MDIKEINAAITAIGGSAITADKIKPIEVIPTGFSDLDDWVFGCGGLPRGKAIELYAKASVGKSTIGYNILGKVQKNGGLCAVFDAEKALTAFYAKACGVDPTTLVVPDFAGGEDMLYKVKVFLALNIFDVILIDSLNAIKPISTAWVNDPNMSEKLAAARMWAQFFNSLDSGYKIKNSENKIIPAQKTLQALDPDSDRFKQEQELHRLCDKKTSLICINHLMDKVGVSYGSKEYTPGGARKEFIFFIRIAASIAETKTGKKDGKEVLKYKTIKLKTKKNKLAPPLRSALFTLHPDGLLESCNKREEVDESEIEDHEEVEEEIVNNPKLSFLKDSLRSQ